MNQFKPGVAVVGSHVPSEIDVCWSGPMGELSRALPGRAAFTKAAAPGGDRVPIWPKKGHARTVHTRLLRNLQPMVRADPVPLQDLADPWP